MSLVREEAVAEPKEEVVEDPRAEG